ncbi:hypothetical protein F511_34747 [Dorcoceras hygrometricum]|uniref:Uncharacterized protein n=1 Tax=Dorcoceras hygrometricum TaxID=472368 RepID=A0A2Z7AGQ7_9LAMI|nr:hypothetical protein F511_34747 [Dorcoceras hygrometricum]
MLPRWHLCLAPTGITIIRLFSVDCGSLRQSGPRPDPRLLRQAALEALTRSARTNTPRKTRPEQFPAKWRRRRAAHGGGVSWEGREAAIVRSIARIWKDDNLALTRRDMIWNLFNGYIQTEAYILREEPLKRRWCRCEVVAENTLIAQCTSRGKMNLK